MKVNPVCLQNQNLRFYCSVDLVVVLFTFILLERVELLLIFYFLKIFRTFMFLFMVSFSTIVSTYFDISEI